MKVPEIKCGNNTCHWQGDWDDLPTKANNSASFGGNISYCPICGSTSFWEIKQLDTQTGLD
jgi:hypothetical protein